MFFVSSEFAQFGWFHFFFPEEMMCLCKALAFDGGNVTHCLRYVEHDPLCTYFVEDFTPVPLPFHLFCAAREARKSWERVKGLAQHCQVYTQKN